MHHITPDRLESLLREAGVLIDLFGDERPNTAEFLRRVSGLCVDAAALLQERDTLLSACEAMEVALARFGPQVEELFGHSEAFCAARQAVRDAVALARAKVPS